ncbi:hypothetical protein DL89DRAFT_130291 [Linderina pennispora]|uniref:Uncharacterized protein n=1 Tax=Linderina pennispora TaxID=61395 RepID=A0A1Y1WDQ6_9FUNG|nr:uncharacterized protein DL89DRAFT_130291 [Linderina pennispora]ORX71659.1 hypothetical protein DL89DRAFT_130291 [Linderina pennispora]
MSEHIKALVARALAVGPENPQQTVGAAFAILNSKIKITVMAFSLAGSLAGAMVLFLIAVFFWRRSLVQPHLAPPDLLYLSNGQRPRLRANKGPGEGK